MKKRPFVLLEILIAIFLITLCVVPLLRNPLYFYKKEIEILKELEITKLQKDCFFKIKKELFTNKITWKDFSATTPKKAQVHILKNQPLKIGKVINQKIDVYYRLWTKKPEKITDQKISKKVIIDISLSKDFEKIGKDSLKNKNLKHTQSYVVYVQKAPLVL